MLNHGRQLIRFGSRVLLASALPSKIQRMSSKRLIKIALSIGMLALVLAVSDISELKATLAHVSAQTALLVILGYFAGQIISSYKWWLITRGAFSVPWLTAFRAYTLGMYANCFGLGVVGGDVVRAMAIAGKGPFKAQAVASVVADRAHGLAVLVLMGVIFALNDGRDTISPNFIYAIMCLPLAVVCAWLLGPKVILKVVPDSHHLREKIENTLNAFPKDPITVLAISVLSVIFHLSQLALHYLILQSMGVNVPWIIVLSSIPFVNVLSSLPISWNGLGVRENAFVFFLLPLVTRAQSVALGAVWLLAVTVSGALGGLVALSLDWFTKRSAQQTAPHDLVS